eukprot:Awhi_evm1s6034
MVELSDFVYKANDYHEILEIVRSTNEKLYEISIRKDFHDILVPPCLVRTGDVGFNLKTNEIGILVIASLYHFFIATIVDEFQTKILRILNSYFSSKDEICSSPPSVHLLCRREKDKFPGYLGDNKAGARDMFIMRFNAYGGVDQIVAKCIKMVSDKLKFKNFDFSGIPQPFKAGKPFYNTTYNHKESHSFAVRYPGICESENSALFHELALNIPYFQWNVDEYEGLSGGSVMTDKKIFVFNHTHLLTTVTDMIKAREYVLAFMPRSQTFSSFQRNDNMFCSG